MITRANLLQTKFFTPKINNKVVRRYRLTRMIEDGLNCRVTLISAPAGYGKTNLLAEWALEYQHTLAWLTLDEGDNDPTHFSDYFTSALLNNKQSKFKQLNDYKLLAQTGDLQQHFANLINHIFNSGEEIIIILDDYHHIHSSTIHNLVNGFIENLPPNAHMILSTRSDPPLNLANWRAQGNLSEIRQADLCFNEAEALSFYKQNIAYDFSLDELSILNEKIEGWAAGMQLAASAISKQTDKHRIQQFIRSFKGTNRYILDYLIEEVLKNQPEEIQEFLLCTSLLDRFCAPLCDQILNRQNSQEILERLDRYNLFIIPLDDKREWYRYHHLFADLLKSQISARQSQKIREIHSKAGDWYEKNENYNEAIDHYLLAEDFVNATRLIQANAKHTLNQSEFITFYNWLRRLPVKHLHSNPTLCAYYAITMIISGRPYQEIKEILQIMEASEDGSKISQTIVQVLIAVFQGDYQKATEMIKLIKTIDPKEDEFLMELLDITQTLFFGIDMEITINRLYDAHKKSRLNGNLTIAITSLCFIGDIYKYQGMLYKAESIFREALELAVIDRDHYMSAGSMAFVGLGEIYYKWNRLEEAETYLKKSIDLAVNLEIIHFFSSLTSIARVQIALGKFEDARASMSKAEKLALRFDTTEVDDFLVACHIIQLKLLMGNPEYLNSKVQIPTYHPIWKKDSIFLIYSLMHDIQELTQAWVLLYKDKYNQAIPLLEELYNKSQKNNMNDAVIQYAVLLAIAYEKIGKHQKAMVKITYALHLSRPENQIRVFLEQGPDIMDLLYEASHQGIEEEFAGRILAAFPQLKAVEKEDQLIHYKDEIIEPLSKRETEVIALIAQGLSNQQIAYKLHLSISTVKVHIYNIFRKLNVHNRTQAVTKAQVLSILPK